MKRYALARRHEVARVAPRTSPPPPPQRGRSFATGARPAENPMVRGLLFGVPIGLALWLVLALFVWAVA